MKQELQEHDLDMLLQFHEVSQESTRAISAITNILQFRKYAIIQEAGTHCRTLYLVLEGAARIFYYQAETEVTEHFAFAGELIIRAESLLTGAPTRKAIEALEDSRLLAIDAARLFALFNKHPELERLYRKMLEKAFVHAIGRIESLQFKSATERYLDLLKQPNLLQRVPLRHIASYLGITQVSLSRIRASISKG
ncbi:MAG: Crp/Fnr family transcriptional regulator [Bacteroidia bacterium]